VPPKEAKIWAKEKLDGIITTLIPTFTSDMEGLNERAIVHDIHEIARQGYRGFSIVTEAGTTREETWKFIDLCAKHAPKNNLLAVLLSTFSTRAENLEMVRYARDAGLDLIQLGYPAMWMPTSLEEVLKYTKQICKEAHIPVILWAAEMWGWCGLLDNPSNYPREFLLELASVDNIVAIKAGTKNREILKELFSKRGIIPGTVSEPAWPAWIRKFDAQWGGISMYHQLFFCPQYFKQMRSGAWEKGTELYFKMTPIRDLWQKMLRAEVGGVGHEWGWTGHNRLRWKYASWLTGLNGGPLRGNFRIAPMDMIHIRKAMVNSEIPVTADEDGKFFEGRKPE
jgi:4-hydroxy-tetrahydrodipicolinate synthase